MDGSSQRKSTGLQGVSSCQHFLRETELVILDTKPRRHSPMTWLARSGFPWPSQASQITESLFLVELPERTLTTRHTPAFTAL